MKSIWIKYGLLFGLVINLLSIGACSGQPNLIEGELETVNYETLRYYLYFPEDYNDKTDDFPLLLFLHGGGEAGADIESLQINGPPKMIVEGKEFPFLILAPQLPYKRRFWNTNAIMQLLENIISDHRIDRRRIYLTGLSRGGTAAWELAAQYPDTFAALAVVCGMTPLPYASWIDKNMPIWVFHGEEDKVISISESEAMVSKLQDMGYEVSFTKYPNVGHDSWTLAYNNEELYNWLIKQKRKD